MSVPNHQPGHVSVFYMIGAHTESKLAMARVVAQQISTLHAETFRNNPKIHELDLSSHPGSSAETSAHIEAELRKASAPDLKNTVVLAHIGGGAASLHTLDALLR